jgi:hypothetical protein
LSLALALAPAGFVHAEEAPVGPPGDPAPRSLAFEKPAIVKKAERIYEKITAAGFYPTIRGLAADTGIGPGLTFWKPRPLGVPVGVLGTVGWNPRVLLLEARVGRVPSRPGQVPDRRFTLEALTTDAPVCSNHRWFVFLEARRLDVTDNRLYFTLGPEGAVQPASIPPSTRFLEDSPNAVTAHFDVEDRDADLVAGYHFKRGLAASIRSGYVRARTAFDPGEEDAPPGLPPIPGVNDTTDFARLRLDLIFDRRDVRNRARRGVLLHGVWLRMDQRGGTLYGFDRFRLDARAFLSTPSRRHTLALRLLGVQDEPEAGKLVPFYFRETLGGNHLLRSYPIFRFRGTRVLGLSAEYRLAVHRFVELAAFYDRGRVSGGLEALGSQGYKDSVGASVRWVSEKDVIFRVFGAYGGEGWRFSAAGAFPF